MKAAVTLLACTGFACTTFAQQAQGEAATSNPPVLVGSADHGATTTGQHKAATTTNSLAVTMDRYVVNESRLHPNRQQQGAPGPTGSRFLDAIQTGVLLQHSGRKFTTEILGQGDPAPGGFSRLKLGVRISW